MELLLIAAQGLGGTGIKLVFYSVSVLDNGIKYQFEVCFVAGENFQHGLQGLLGEFSLSDFPLQSAVGAFQFRFYNIAVFCDGFQGYFEVFFFRLQVSYLATQICQLN
jgi:hypothetical protein